jgi:glycosyltransferase involved in cell wall biosynthesis
MIKYEANIDGCLQACIAGLFDLKLDSVPHIRDWLNEEGEWCRKEIAESKNIRLIEWLRHDDPLFASAYAACHTFILPTRYETPGRAALEASLAGANLVITPFGGTTEYFRNFAEYVNPHSVELIVKGIEKSLNNKKNEKLRNHIAENFVWEIIARQTAEMYRGVL